MIYIFDLDCTLLDTIAFKMELIKALEIDEVIFKKHIKEYFKGTNYSVNEHVLRLVQTENEKSRLHDNLQKVWSKMESFLYKESIAFLEYLYANRFDHPIYLMTKGNQEFQEKKVKSLNIEKYFDKIIYVENDKAKVLRNLQTNHSEMLIINDNAKENLAIENLNKKCVIKQIKSPYSSNVDHHYQIYSLSSLFNEIQDRE